MNGIHQIEPTSTDSLLACLSLAIDEARLVRTIVATRDQANRLAEQPAEARRLAFLNRKVERLEVELADIRRRANLGLAQNKAAQCLTG